MKPRRVLLGTIFTAMAVLVVASVAPAAQGRAAPLPVPVPPVVPTAPVAGRLAVTATEILSTSRTVSNLDSVSCGTPTTCITASWPPQRTTDGGATWTSLRVGDGLFGDWLTDVDCLSASLCFGLSNSRLLRTNDLGTTWTAMTPPAGVSFGNFLSCATTQHCTVEGSTTTGLRFLTTLDGGISWTVVGPLVTGTVQDLECGSANFCVASFYDHVMRSTDSGVTWTPIALTTPTRHLDCPSADVCVAVGTGVLELFTQTTHTEYATTLPGFGLGTVACGSPTTCVIFDWGFGATAAVTIDLQQGHLTVVNLPSDLGIVRATNCIGGRCIALGEPVAADAASSELAVTATASAPYDTWTTTANQTRIERYIAMTCATENTCIVVGATGQQSLPAGLSTDLASNGLVRRTTDAGLTWSLVTVPQDVRLIYSVACTLTTCVASAWSSDPAGRATVIVSRDGGQTWSHTQLSMSGVNDSSVECAGSVCYVVSTLTFAEASRVAVTLDGGQTWGAQTIVPGFGSIMCATSAACLLVMNDGSGTSHLYRTTDTGTTFTPVPSPAGVTGTELHECLPDRCFATVTTAAGRQLWSTADLGATWSTASANSDSPVIDCAPTRCLVLKQSDVERFVAPSAVGSQGEPGAKLDLVEPHQAACLSAARCFVFGLGGSKRGEAVFRLDLRDRPVVSVAPARLLESRSGPGVGTVDGLDQGVGVIGAGTVYTLAVRGRGGIPGDAATAMVTVTVTEPVGPGFVTVYPCDQPRPRASNLNYTANQSVANAATSPIAANGTICLFTSAATHLIVDANAYVPAGVAGVNAVAPARLLESRSGPGLGTIDGRDEGVGAIAAGTVYTLDVRGRGGIAADAATAMMTVTVTEPVGPGFVTVYPCDQPRPRASNLNYTADQTVADAAISPIAANGTICLFTSATTHLVVDANAYVFSGAAGVSSVAPARLLESRTGPGLGTVDGVGQGAGPISAGTVYTLAVRGRAGIPGDAVTAVVTLTVTEPVGPGFVTVYPCDQPRPRASNLNFTANQTVANAAISPIAANGTICLFTSATTHLVVDVNAYST